MNIYVSNISYTATDEALQAAFAVYGEVTSARIIKDRLTSRSRGFGFVEMANEEEGKKALEALAGFDLMGRAIAVREARPREEGEKKGGKAAEGEGAPAGEGQDGQGGPVAQGGEGRPAREARPARPARGEGRPDRGPRNNNHHNGQNGSGQNGNGNGRNRDGRDGREPREAQPPQELVIIQRGMY